MHPTLNSAKLVLALCLIFACSSCLTAPSPQEIDVVDSQFQGPPAIELSSAQKRRLAERVAEYYDTRLVLADPENFYLQRVLAAKDALEAQSGESYRYGVYLSNRIHAFALASGDIRIHSGLLDVVSADDEIFALLACLQTLIRKGYAEESVEQSYNAAVAKDPEVEEELKKQPFTEAAIGNVAERTTLYRFSIEQLHACDAAAAAQLRKINVDPQAGLRLVQRFERFEKSSNNAGQLFDISRSQPMATSRATLLAKLLRVQLPEIQESAADSRFADLPEDLENPTEEESQSGSAQVPAQVFEQESEEVELAGNVEQDSMASTSEEEISANSHQTTQGVSSSRDTPSQDLAPDSDELPVIQSATLRATRKIESASSTQNTSTQTRISTDSGVAKTIDATAKTEEVVKNAITPAPTQARPVAASKVNDWKASPVGNPSSTVSPGWYVQISADADAGAAESRAAEARAQGFSVSIQAIQVKNVDYNRVLIGPFETRDSANAQRSVIEKRAVSDGTPFVRQLP